MHGVREQETAAPIPSGWLVSQLAPGAPPCCLGTTVQASPGLGSRQAVSPGPRGIWGGCEGPGVLLRLGDGACFLGRGEAGSLGAKVPREGEAGLLSVRRAVSPVGAASLVGPKGGARGGALRPVLAALWFVCSDAWER